MRGSALVLSLVLLTACSDQEPLPQAAAQGPIRLWQWRSDDREPVVLDAAEITQLSGRPGGADMVLDLHRVALRVPFTDGVALVHAPDGTYAAQGDPRAVLPAPSGRPGLVTLVLEHQGTAGVGQATRAWIPAASEGSHLEDIELIHAGLHSFHRQAILDGRTMQVAGQGWSKSAPPAVSTALAALPKGILR